MIASANALLRYIEEQAPLHERLSYEQQAQNVRERQAQLAAATDRLAKVIDKNEGGSKTSQQAQSSKYMDEMMRDLDRA